MQSKAATVEQYLAELPADRRKALETVRAVILKNLDKRGYEEGMQYGMIGYYVPHRVFPAGYHCDPRQPVPFAALASQKGHMSVYLMGIYGDPSTEAWFREQWAKSGKKLDMGKSCVRFKKVEDLALDVVGQAIKRLPAAQFIERYEAATSGMRKGAPKKKAAAAEEPAPKKAAAAEKPAAKKTAAAPKQAAKKPAAKKQAGKK
jgi:hypothetical protein